MKRDNQTLRELLYKKYGKLTIIGIDKEESRRLRQVMLICECECGNKHAIVPKYRVLNGTTTTCGKCTEFLFKDKIVGDFKIIGKNAKVSKTRNLIAWDCKCTTCGYIRVFSTHEINEGIANNHLPCNKCVSLNRRNNTIDTMLKRRKFGFLEIIKYDIDNSTSGADKYVCKCTRCGKIVYGVEGDNLRTGISQSCGCARSKKEANKDLSKFVPTVISKEEKNKIAETEHISGAQLEYNMKNTYKLQSDNPEAYEESYYRSILKQTHRKMVNRTTDENDKEYKRYGAVGRDISEDWLDFENFYKDVIESYKKAEKLYPGITLHIDRINNNIGYSNTNFRFVPVMVNSNNSIANSLFEYCGQIWDYAMISRAFGKDLDLTDADIRNRISYGWTLEEAISTPKNKSRNSRVPISPIYYVDDIKEKHKSSQGLNTTDVDYMYNDGSININEDIRGSLEKIVEHNKSEINDAQSSGGLFSHLKELGKYNK